MPWVIVSKFRISSRTTSAAAIVAKPKKNPIKSGEHQKGHRGEQRAGDRRQYDRERDGNANLRRKSTDISPKRDLAADRQVQNAEIAVGDVEAGRRDRSDQGQVQHVKHKSVMHEQRHGRGQADADSSGKIRHKGG